MKTKEEIKNWLLENAVNEDGDLVLNNLDFSDFNGDVYIGHMKVKGDLYQYGHEVGGSLYQHGHEVGGSLYQSEQEIQGNLSQGCQEVKGNLYNKNNKYGGNLHENPSTKLLKKISIEELAELGYTLKGE